MIIKYCEKCRKEYKAYPKNQVIRRFCSFECRKSIYTKEMKTKMGEIKKEQFKNGLKPWNTGIPFKSNDALDRYRKEHNGYKMENHPMWKGGVSKINQKLRSSPEYQSWRKGIFERDDYRCMDCGERGGELQADHIYSFSKYLRLRLDPLNGQTRCKKCHKAKTIFERLGVYEYA